MTLSQELKGQEKEGTESQESPVQLGHGGGASGVGRIQLLLEI